MQCPTAYKTLLPTAGFPVMGASPSDLSAASNRVNFDNFTSFTVAGRFDGTQINTIFPLAKRVQTYTFQQDVFLYMITFSTSIINYDASSPCVARIMTDQGVTVGTNGASNLYNSHIVEINSQTGFIASTSRNNFTTFGSMSAIKVNAGSGIGVYLSSANNAGNIISFEACLFWVPYTGM